MACPSGEWVLQRAIRGSQPRLACSSIMAAPQHITRTGQFESIVTAVESLSPRMRRITLGAADIAARDWPLASDIAIVLAGEDGREVRRRYTVRSVTGEHLVVDAVLHGHGPGSSWAESAAAGDSVTFIGPRGQIEPAEATWLLALTDESGLPAIAAVAEALDGRPIHVLAEIADPDEKYPLPANATVQWLPRGDRPPGTTDLLLPAIGRQPHRSGRGFGYVLGESRAVVALRDALPAVGLSRGEVYAKGYWNLNSRPTR